MKFETSDQRYLDARKEFSKMAGPRELWSVMDHWPLYCGIENLRRCLKMVDLLKSTLHVPGDIAEFGSWRGGNLMLLAKALKIYDGYGGKRVHCFDSFEGLTEFVQQDAGKDKDFRGTYKGNYEELRDMIKLYEMQDDVVVHKGLIENTLPPLMEKDKHLSFSFVYCDTDLYSSTHLILKHLHPRMMKGGIFLFDEWNQDMWPGEGVAANEFVKEFGSYYQPEAVVNSRQPTMVLRKIKD